MTAIVVLHYEKIPLTAECCKTLVVQKEPARVLVVDNGSPSHGEAELKAALPPEVELLRLPENRGFGGGMNAGMRKALADPATDSILFLNNDTRCPPEMVGAMREALAADPAVGLVGCDMEGAGGGEDAPASYRFGRPFYYAHPCRPGEAPDYVQASCILLPRDVLEKIGGFDEDFHFFFEDADLSLRVRKLGRTLAIVPGVKIYHYGSATIGAVSVTQAEWFRTGHRIFLRKWLSFPRLRALPPFLGSVAWNLVRGRLSALKGSVRGYFKPILITKR